jgi:hypothetical protein
MKKQFRNMKPGTIFFVDAWEDGRKGFALAKLWQPLPSQMKCHSCGTYQWNATNFKNTVHVCPINKHEITGYLIDQNQEGILLGHRL